MEKDPSQKYQEQLTETRRYWDEESASFDQEPDHGLLDPHTRAAWTELLTGWLPAAHSRILDIGCGTGTLSALLTGLGYEVTGIDLSPKMIARAEEKAAAQGYAVSFHIMDAAFPQLLRDDFDVLVCRHLLWALPDIDQVLQRWSNLLKPDGRLILIEGFWDPGAGLHADEIRKALPPVMKETSFHNLRDQPILWGGPVKDERYALITTRTV